eukprot:3541719-Prorocentrum_lima.AAC.1
MTSSLVGSEMCIRDSTTFGTTSLRAHTHAPRPPPRSPRITSTLHPSHRRRLCTTGRGMALSLIHISEPTRLDVI